MSEVERTEEAWDYVRMANVMLHSHMTFYSPDIDEQQMAGLEAIATLLEKACGGTLAEDRELLLDVVDESISENK